jgi:hypothetical protein
MAVEIDCRRGQSSAVYGVASNTDDQTPITDDASRAADSPTHTDKGAFMSNANLKAQFGKISDTARTAAGKVDAAGERTREQLEVDVAVARNRVAAAADRMNGKADAARENASSDWKEIRDKWYAHVAKVRARAHQKKDQIDAHNAAVDAEMAEAYAYDAIEFALDAIDEAEYAALDAIYARADAEALNA